MSDLNLLPCPFCGGNAEWQYADWDENTETGDDGTGFVVCQSCRAEIFGHDRDDAERIWNRRHDLDQAKQEVKPS